MKEELLAIKLKVGKLLIVTRQPRIVNWFGARRRTPALSASMCACRVKPAEVTTAAAVA
jgi:hypothetical protein